MRLLDLPLWKWAALVEHWAWTHVPEDGQPDLQRMLDRNVDFGWWPRYHSGGSPDVSNPLAWQTNQPGEVLISARRKKPKE